MATKKKDNALKIEIDEIETIKPVENINHIEAAVLAEDKPAEPKKMKNREHIEAWFGTTLAFDLHTEQGKVIHCQGEVKNGNKKFNYVDVTYTEDGGKVSISRLDLVN